MITAYKIESELEANSYLKGLLENKDNQSIHEIEQISLELIDDENLRAYFIEAAKRVLNA